MRSELRPALMVLLLMTLVTGVVYPLVVTALARGLFPDQAAGSLIISSGHSAGSRLIGQTFDQPRYFWGRLSATGPVPYNAAASSGSNYGPLNPALVAAAQARIDALKAADPQAGATVPVDLVTASGSGLDPHMSLAAAAYQVQRVARARGMSADRVQALVGRFTTGRTLGLLGEPVVNVLELNRSLDSVLVSAAR